jgi:zinc transport system substrate-binding protein
MILMFNRVWRAGLAVVVALAGLGAASCSAGSLWQEDGLQHVVVGLYPFEWLVQAVGGDAVAIMNVTQPGAEPHDAELTARQVAAVAEADLVVYLPGLQPALDEAVAQAQVTALDLSTVVTLLPLAEGAHDDEDGDGHDEGGLDPHVWLDPVRMSAIADAVAAALAASDPAHAAAYEQGRDGVKAELDALAADYAAGLASCERDTFITSHAAFGYLAARFGLTQVPIAGLSPDAEPSPARLAEVRATAEDLGVTTIFFETLASPALAQTIADELGLATAVLDPVEGVTEASAASDYIGLMRANLAALEEANGCR